MPQSIYGQREQTGVVMDISKSMELPYDGQYNKLEAAVRAKINMILHKEQIDPDDEIGIVTFNHKADMLLPLHPISSHKQQIIDRLQGLFAEGGTDINEGLKVARDLFDWSRNDVVRRIVLLTDGCGGHPCRTAEDLKSRGVVIDVIAVGHSEEEVNVKLLKKVASVVDGELRYRFIKDQQTLVAHITQLGGKTAVC
jgi:Mg-chelatase subunit ChlD